MTGWLAASAELKAYEGIRRGHPAAFRALAEPLRPALRRLAGLYVDDEAAVDTVVLRSWEMALRGLSMFRWHTPLATWVAGITVAFGRAHHLAGEGPPPTATAPMPSHPVPGPPDWSDLPWGRRWQDAPADLGDTLAALPIDQREVLHGRDIEQWPPRRVCEVFGLPEVSYEQLLAEAHANLRDTLAPLVGQAGPSRHRDAQIASIIAWLNSKADDRTERLDQRTMAIYRRWWAARQSVWRRLSQPMRQLAG